MNKCQIFPNKVVKWEDYQVNKLQILSDKVVTYSWIREKKNEIFKLFYQYIDHWRRLPRMITARKTHNPRHFSYLGSIVSRSTSSKSFYGVLFTCIQKQFLVHTTFLCASKGFYTYYNQVIKEKNHKIKLDSYENPGRIN